MPVASLTSSTSSKARAQTRTQVALHPLTGVPLLLLEEDAEDEEGYPHDEVAAPEYDSQEDEAANEWPVDDESDIDWLGRELLHRLGGANVWVLGAGEYPEPPQQDITPSAREAPTSQSTQQSIICRNFRTEARISSSHPANCR